MIEGKGSECILLHLAIELHKRFHSVFKVKVCNYCVQFIDFKKNPTNDILFTEKN